MGRLSGKIALVTGGSSGIGKGIALGYAREGATVALSSRDLARARAVVALIEQAGGAGLALACDVRRRDEVDGMVAAVERAYGRIDILINNAGIPMVAPSE